jgi:hypothetical protein
MRACVLLLPLLVPLSLLACGGTVAPEEARSFTPYACDATKPFGAPSPVPGLPDRFASIGRPSRDELQLFFAMETDDELRLHVATRTDRSLPFGPPKPVLLAGVDPWPGSLSADGLSLLVHGDGAAGDRDAFVVRRTSFDAPSFSVREPLGSAVDSPADESGAHLSSDGSTLYFARRVGATRHLFRATGTGFTVVEPLAELNGEMGEILPVPSADDRVLYFTRGDRDRAEVWRASRAEAHGPYTTIARVSELPSAAASWVSPDDCRIYLSVGYPELRLAIADRGR